MGPHLESLCFSPQLFCFFEPGPKAVRREESGQLEKTEIQGQELWATSMPREGTHRGNVPKGLQTPPYSQTPGTGRSRAQGPGREDGVHRILLLPESHRIRIVELKPHKSIQVIRGHPYEGEAGVRVRGSSQESST